MNIHYEEFDWDYEVDGDELRKAKKKILKSYSVDQLVDIIMDLDQCVDEPLEDYYEDLITDLECEFYEKAKAEKEDVNSNLFEEKLYTEKFDMWRI
jgi:energy-converting hydrogenase A subunit M